jgi:hypothetical protein
MNFCTLIDPIVIALLVTTYFHWIDHHCTWIHIFVYFVYRLNLLRHGVFVPNRATSMYLVPFFQHSLIHSHSGANVLQC